MPERGTCPGLIVRRSAAVPKAQTCAQTCTQFDNLGFSNSMADPHSTEQFNTWPEIAGYLGISVREAQYRAKNEGLPVRRGVGKKPRVWVLRSELDAWRIKAGVDTAAPVPNPGTAQPPPDVASRPPIEDAPTVQWGRRAVLSVAGLAATARRS